MAERKTADRAAATLFNANSTPSARECADEANERKQRGATNRLARGAAYRAMLAGEPGADDKLIELCQPLIFGAAPRFIEKRAYRYGIADEGLDRDDLISASTSAVVHAIKDELSRRTEPVRDINQYLNKIIGRAMRDEADARPVVGPAQRTQRDHRTRGNKRGDKWPAFDLAAGRRLVWDMQAGSCLAAERLGELADPLAVAWTGNFKRGKGQNVEAARDRLREAIHKLTQPFDFWRFDLLKYLKKAIARSPENTCRTEPNKGQFFDRQQSQETLHELDLSASFFDLLACCKTEVDLRIVLEIDTDRNAKREDIAERAGLPEGTFEKHLRQIKSTYHAAMYGGKMLPTMSPEMQAKAAELMRHRRAASAVTDSEGMRECSADLPPFGGQRRRSENGYDEICMGNGRAADRLISELAGGRCSCSPIRQKAPIIHVYKDDSGCFHLAFTPIKPGYTVARPTFAVQSVEAVVWRFHQRNPAADYGSLISTAYAAMTQAVLGLQRPHERHANPRDYIMGVVWRALAQSDSPARPPTGKMSESKNLYLEGPQQVIGGMHKNPETTVAENGPMA